MNNVVAQQHQDHFAKSDIPTFIAWKARWLVRRENRRRISYFNSLPSNAFSRDAAHGFGSSATVSYVALQMAYWMGAETVILLGIDHSFVYKGPEATYQRREGPDLNHFDPNYFKPGTLWGTPDLERSELEYRLAREAFESSGRRVVDATVGGKLNVFEKISIDEAKSILMI